MSSQTVRPCALYGRTYNKENSKCIDQQRSGAHRAAALCNDVTVNSKLRCSHATGAVYIHFSGHVRRTVFGALRSVGYCRVMSEYLAAQQPAHPRS